MPTIPGDNPYGVPSVDFTLIGSKFYWWNPAPVGNNFCYVYTNPLMYGLMHTPGTYGSSSFPRMIIASEFNDFLEGTGFTENPSEFSPPLRETYVQNVTLQGKTAYYITDSPNATTANIETNAVINYEVNYTSTDISRTAWLMVYGGYGSFSVTYDLENCVGAAENPADIPPNAVITLANFTVDEGFEFTSGSCWIDGDGFPSGTPVNYVWDPETGGLRIGTVTSNITVHVHAYGDPYADIDGEADLPGGGTVPVPGLPGLSAVSTGMLGLFAPTVSQMQLLADFMWTDFGGTGTTEVDVLKEIVQAIKRNISNPLDYVVGLNIIPSQGLSIGAAAEVRFGFVNSGISMPRLTNQYFTVNCGTVYFPPVCKDTFLDYAPYSKFSIYLPYIGYKDLNANDCVGHTIGVIYHGDTVTGGITAYVTKDGNVFYQYSGCCALTLPLSSDSWGTTISGALQVASALGVGVLTGGAAGIANAAINSTSSVAGNPSLLSPQVARSGAVSGGAGLMGVQHPVIIREAVSFHDTTGFNTVSGYPSWYYKQLADVSGYTTVVDVHLHNIPATQGEIEEIEQKLKEGVIL